MHLELLILNINIYKLHAHKHLNINNNWLWYSRKRGENIGKFGELIYNRQIFYSLKNPNHSNPTET